MIDVLDMFTNYRPAMPDTPHLRPATPDEIADALSFALRYQGRKRVHHADDMMARITAERLVQHLEAFVVMKGHPATAPTTANPDTAAPMTSHFRPVLARSGSLVGDRNRAAIPG